METDTAYNSVITPIYQTSTFRFEDIGKTKGYEYTRSGNPTRTALEDALAAMEGGTTARVTSTGMSAITAALHFFRTGDHIVCASDCYGGTERVLRLYAETFGLEVSYADFRNLAEVKNAIKPNTKALWIETPSNPLLNIFDIKKLCEIAHNHKAIAICDNTFLSPVNQRPFEHGADVVVHSMTKYLNGHSDVVGGAVIVKDKTIAERLSYVVNALGLSEAPFDAWLVMRGMKTLVPRMKMHEENAMAVAKFLEKHRNVAKTNYPGLSNHPGHELAKKQQYGFGGMVSFEVRGGLHDANKVLTSTKVFTLAESLGGIESLICHPVTMTHAAMPVEQREKAGINDRIIRLSVGIEDVNDLLEDLDEALNY
jgi:cystathionine gamma-synthase